MEVTLQLNDSEVDDVIRRRLEEAYADVQSYPEYKDLRESLPRVIRYFSSPSQYREWERLNE